jgi:hypothetical protein
MLLSKENGNELIHTSIRKEKVWRIGHQARGRDKRMLLGLKKFQEGCSNFGTGHHVR